VALCRLHAPANESGAVRPGEAVYHWSRKASFPLHAGIYAGESSTVSGPSPTLDVLSLPGTKRAGMLGTSTWGEPGNWHADILGLRPTVDETKLKEVLLIAQANATELSGLGQDCCWSKRLDIDPRRTTRDGIPLFLAGSCSQYVEFLYEQAGLDLVDQAYTYSIDHPNRLFPATQIHAFWTGQYPLRVSPWDPRLETYEACLFDTRSVGS